MRKVADSCCDKIMFFRSENKGDCTKRGNQLCEIGNSFQSNFSSGSNNIVSIFQEMITGIGKTAALGACHWVAADKFSFESKFGYFFVDDAFYTAHICEDTVFSKRILDLFHVLHIEFYRGTEEKIITVV